VGAGQRDECGPRVLLDVGGVDDGEPPGGEPLAGDVVQRLERLGGDRLVVLVVGEHGPELVGREHACRGEVPAAKVLLPDPVTPISTTRQVSGSVIFML
jgi:hypothetical protein